MIVLNYTYKEKTRKGLHEFYILLLDILLAVEGRGFLFNGIVRSLGYLCYSRTTRRILILNREDAKDTKEELRRSTWSNTGKGVN